jgi:hypothetical protein
LAAIRLVGEELAARQGFDADVALGFAVELFALGLPVAVGEIPALLPRGRAMTVGS